MNEHLFTPDRSKTVQMEITPESAGWTYLSFAIVGLKPGERHDHLLADQETAVVPISGSATVKVGGIETTLSRTSVFEEMPRIARPTRRRDRDRRHRRGIRVRYRLGTGRGPLPGAHYRTGRHVQ